MRLCKSRLTPIHMQNGKRSVPFVQLDVFSSRSLEGNPLAVFADGRGLSDGEMQAIAREMNLSETTFILPRDATVEKERGVRVRIFTVQEELPFAGHPTLGYSFFSGRRNWSRRDQARPKRWDNSRALRGLTSAAHFRGDDTEQSSVRAGPRPKQDC